RAGGAGLLPPPHGAHLPSLRGGLSPLLAAPRALRPPPAALDVRRDRRAARGHRLAGGGVLPRLPPDVARPPVPPALAPPRRRSWAGLAPGLGDLRARPRPHGPPPGAARRLLPGARLRLAQAAHRRRGGAGALPRLLQRLLGHARPGLRLALEQRPNALPT